MLFLEYIWLVPLFPALGAAIMFFFGRRLGRRRSMQFVSARWPWPSCFPAARCGSTRTTPTHNPGKPFEKIVYTWLGTDTGHMNYVRHDGTTAPFQADAGFLLDPLSGIWLLFVTGVGMLIHVYSTGYMAHEGGYYRFFGYLNLFMFSMLTLVLANNYVMMFVGWEGVGLCSYLLIGFYFHRNRPATRARRLHREPRW